MARLVALAALALAACSNHGIPRSTAIEATFLATTPAAELAKQFEVVAFNVHMQNGDKLAKAIASDRELHDADVIVMEEVHRSLPVDVSKPSCSGACVVGTKLGYHVVYAPGHATGDGDDGVAILSRAPITSAHVIELPSYNVHLNSGRRIALAATVQQAGRPITIYAVHLENRITVAQRRAQMQPVLADAEAQPTPVIMAGDFNTSPFTWIAHLIPVLTTTQDNRLEELVRARGFATPVADSGPTSRFLGMKLDAIYTRGFETRRFGTAHARDVSDHLALFAFVR